MNLTCLHRARSGDPAASEEIVQSLRPRLTRMAAYYARYCPEEADDLLQEAWTGLLEVLPTVDLAIGDPEQFLLRYARWRLLDAIKRSARRQCTDLPEDYAPVGHDISVDGVNLALFVQLLSPYQRAVVACLLAGLTWREAGRLLGCTSANIAYHVRQIREKYVSWQAESSPVL